MNAGKTKTGLGLNRKGRGTTQTKNGHHRAWKKVSLSCPKCPKMWNNKVLVFSLSLSVILKRQCGASACGERGVNHKAMDCKMILPRSLCSHFCFLPFQFTSNQEKDCFITPFLLFFTSLSSNPTQLCLSLPRESRLIMRRLLF